MSTVTLQYNISNKRWKGTENSLTSNYCDLLIGFASNQTSTVFDNLSFGFKLTTSNKVLQSQNFPENDIVVYRSTAEPHLVSVPLNLEPNTTYTLTVWAENAGERKEFDYTFKTPHPTDTGDYINSSVPYPDTRDPNKYRFNEATREWVIK